jgi:hypothetical protein
MVCYQYYFCAYFYESTMQILNIKKSKQISAETFLGNGQLLLSEKYRYEVVGAHNVTFSQLTWALLRGKQLCGGLSLCWLKYFFCLFVVMFLFGFVFCCLYFCSFSLCFYRYLLLLLFLVDHYLLVMWPFVRSNMI